METPRELCRPENEVEAGSMMVLLEEEGIAYVELRQRDSAYPGVADFGRWGVLIVDANDLDRARHLVEDLLESVRQAGEGIDEEELTAQALAAAEPE